MKVSKKNIIIYTIISIYFFGMIVFLFGIFLQHYQTVRQEYQSQKFENTTTLVFTQNEWNNFEDKNEIKHDNNYYDVISCQKHNNSIVVKAVKDSTENHLRVAIAKVLKKHKNPISNSKNNLKFSKHIVSKVDFNIGLKHNFVEKIKHNFDLNFNQKIKNFIFIIENPPC